MCRRLIAADMMSVCRFYFQLCSFCIRDKDGSLAGPITVSQNSRRLLSYASIFENEVTSQFTLRTRMRRVWCSRYLKIIVYNRELKAIILTQKYEATSILTFVADFIGWTEFSSVKNSQLQIHFKIHIFHEHLHSSNLISIRAI